MANGIERLVVDCSVIVKWKIPTEDDAAAAEQLMLDWEHGAVEVRAPYLLQAEVMSAFLRANRRERLSADEAREAIRDLLALPFVLVDVTSPQWRSVRLQSRSSTSSEPMIAYMWPLPNGKVLSCGPVIAASTMRCTSITRLSGGSATISANIWKKK